MNTLKALSVAVMLAVPVSTHAQKIDLTTMKCSQLIQTSKENMSTIAPWLLGYYSDANEPEIIDLTKMKEVGEKLNKFCAEYPNHVVSGAAEGLLNK